MIIWEKEWYISEIGGTFFNNLNYQSVAVLNIEYCPFTANLWSPERLIHLHQPPQAFLKTKTQIFLKWSIKHYIQEIPQGLKMPRGIIQFDVT